MATQLGLYAAASTALGEAVVTSTAEDRALVNSLTSVYADVLAVCLEEGQWNFAEVLAKIDADGTFVWSFGYRYRFIKPATFVNLTGISFGEYVDRLPLSDYKDEGGFWYADSTPIYVRYTDSTVGADLTKWSASYARYVALALAHRVAHTTSISDADYKTLVAELTRAKRDAMSKDARLDGSKSKPPGRLVQSRWGRSARDPFLGT